MIGAWTVPWDVMMPAFLGAIVLSFSLGWLIARWWLLRHVRRQMPEEIRVELAEADSEIRWRNREIRRLESVVHNQDSLIANHKQKFKSIILLVGDINTQEE